MIPAYPIKLPDGTWGARVDSEEDIKPGDRLAMTSARGETWVSEVIQVIERYRCTHLCKVRRLSA